MQLIPTIVCGLLLLAIPLVVIFRLRLKLLSPLLRGVLLMLVQLAIIAVCVAVLVKWDNAWTCLLWVVLMSAIATWVTLRKARMGRREAMAVGAGVLTATVVVGLLVVLFGYGSFGTLGARWVVPTVGVIHACMSPALAVGLRGYADAYARGQGQRELLLGNGATRLESLMPFVREAVGCAFAPAASRLSSMGLVAMPLVFCGLLLGGVEPLMAVVWEFLLVGAVLSATLMALLVAITMLNQR